MYVFPGQQGRGLEAHVNADGTADVTWIADSIDVAELNATDAQVEHDWMEYLRTGPDPDFAAMVDGFRRLPHDDRAL